MRAWGEEIELSFLHALCAELEVNYFQLLKMMTILDTKNFWSQNPDKLSLWFLKQTDRLATVEEFEDLRGGIDNSRIEVNEDEEVSSTIYPPYDENILKTMVQYLHEFKRYDVVNKALVPIHLMPTETVCHD